MTITIETHESDDQRIAEAYQWAMGLDHPATQEEITETLTKQIMDTTNNYERFRHQKEFEPPPFTPPPER